MPSSTILFLLLLLFLLPPCLGCQTSSFTECQQAPFVPGHNLAGEGFDVVKMKTTGANVINVKDFMVGGQQGNCTVCYNHLLKQTQKLPVSVLDWRVEVKCRRRLTSKFFESSQSVMKEISSSLSASWKVGLDFRGLFGFAFGGSHSSSSKFAYSRSKKDKFSFITHGFRCQYYTFRIHSTPPLSKDFEDSLKDLPSTYHHKNTSAFQQFIAVYGTHYIRRVQLGGRVHSMTAVRTCEAALSSLSAHTVSTCLSSEASVTVIGITSKVSAAFCRKQGKKLQHGYKFSQVFNDRTTEVLGGDGGTVDILFNPNGADEYKRWLRSLKRLPGVVSYQISPLHLLITDNPILKSTLREAISDYIRKSAKPLSCNANCKMGTRKKNCACQCAGHLMVDTNCCPAELGVARMDVTVVRAEGLWSSFFSKTDGYVKIFYGNQGSTTPVMWNSEFPEWNYLIRFQSVNLRHKRPIRFEVWDRNHVWSDRLLGKVSLIPTMGNNINKKLMLKHGSLIVKLSVVCAPSLQGSLCEQYAESPNYEGPMGHTEKVHWGSWRFGEDGALSNLP